MAHTPRQRPTTSHTRTPITHLPAIRAHTIRSVLHQEAGPLFNAYPKSTGGQTQMKAPSIPPRLITPSHVYVGWDGAICVWGERERVSVPLVYRQRRKIGFKAPASPLDILIRRYLDQLSRLRLHIRRRRSLLLIAHNPLPVLPTSIFKRIQTRSSSRRQPLVRPRIHGQRRELRRQCQSRRERRLPQQFRP